MDLERHALTGVALEVDQRGLAGVERGGAEPTRVMGIANDYFKPGPKAAFVILP